MNKNNNNDGFLPPDTGRSLPLALLRAREAVMERFRPVLFGHNITEQQWRVLRVLGEAGEMEASQLAVRACVLAPSLTRIIKTLEAAGLITSCKDKVDGRRTLLAIDQKGHDLIALVSPECCSHYSDIEDAFGHEEMERLLDTLEELQKLLRDCRK